MLRRATQADHVLLTRFNLPTRGVEASPRTGRLLQDRVELFEHYCAPSVANRPTGLMDRLLRPREPSGDG